jgi:phospholipid/cholesterol/gamma-HCH transport system substrate-binding protein
MNPTARVGLFMLLALIVLGVFIVKIEEIPIGSKGGRKTIRASFPSVAGLDEKSPVRIAGVRVGIVEEIALDGDRAMVTLSIDPQVTLHQGARAEVSSLGMLGDKYVELFPGVLSGPPLQPDTVLDGTSPLAFDQVLKTANDVGGDIQAVTASLRKTLGGDEGQKRLDEILENIRQLSADTRALVAANRSDIDATIANFRSFSETLKTELPKLAEKLNGLADRVDAVVEENRGNLSGSLENIKDLSGRLRVSADNLNQITGKIARGEGSIGKLVNDDETVNNLNATLKSVESGVQSLKNTVGRAEGWKLNLNIRAEALPSLDSDNSSRSALGLDLQTVPQRFFRLELVDSPFGRIKTTTDVVTVVLPDGSRQITTTETVHTSESATVNAQVGFFLRSDLVVRAGVFESTGGVGIDQSFLRDKLKISLEAYDFNRNTKPPHVRLEARYFLNRNLFAYAGWDDPIWSQRSSAIFGGGVTWGDEDVKYLLGTASAVPR